MAENKRGVQYGGPWRYGWQPGMTNDLEELTILRYTNPLAAEAYEALQEIVRSRRKPNE